MEDKTLLKIKFVVDLVYIIVGIIYCITLLIEIINNKKIAELEEK